MNYPGDPPAPAPNGHEPAKQSKPRVKDVLTAFGRLRAVGDYMAVKDAGIFPTHRYTQKNQRSNRAKVHFQSIQRHRDGRHALLVGGDAIDNTSQLFTIRMGTRRTKGPWGSNIIKDGKAPEKDAVVHITALDKGLWHPGGIDLCGDILAIPIETDTKQMSRVIFLDVADPVKPILLKPQLDRTAPPIERKATAVALCRLPQNDHFLCAVLSGNGDDRRIDFYLSGSSTFEDGFTQHVVWKNAQLLPTHGRDFDFQAINFIAQRNGALYVIGSENKSPLSPLKEDDDLAELFTVELPPETLQATNPILGVPTITRVATKEFVRGGEYANMDAAGGVHIAPNGELTMYAGFHWRRKDEIHLSEYRSEVPVNAAPITQPRDAWVDLYEHRGFKGRRLSVLGKLGTSFSDYGKIRVQGKGFGNQVSSIRYQIPSGLTYRLFDRPKFEDKGPTSTFDLNGTGNVVEIIDLDDHDFSEEVSSSKYV